MEEEIQGTLKMIQNSYPYSLTTIHWHFIHQWNQNLYQTTEESKENPANKNHYYAPTKTKPSLEPRKNFYLKIEKLKIKNNFGTLKDEK